MKRTSLVRGLASPRAGGTKAESSASEEDRIDEILAESFPASDPPPWTLGVLDSARGLAQEPIVLAAR